MKTCVKYIIYFHEHAFMKTSTADSVLVMNLYAARDLFLSGGGSHFPTFSGSEDAKPNLQKQMFKASASFMNLRLKIL